MGVQASEGEPLTQWCLVYDRNTGAVVHIHQHISFGRSRAPEADLAEAALEHAVQTLEEARADYERDSLRVAHPPEEISLSPELIYRVDVDSGRVRAERDIVIERARAGLREPRQRPPGSLWQGLRQRLGRWGRTR